MRTVKQRNTSISRFLFITALVLTAPAIIHAARQNAELGGRAAIFSAVLNMPDSGIRLLRERFKSELYGEIEAGPEAESKQGAAPPVSGPDVPERASGPEDTPGPQAGDIPAENGKDSIKPPKIPKKYEAEIISENFAGQDGGTLISFGAGFIKNDTKQSDSKVEKLLEEGFELGLTDTGEPQVLIFHTHATESFEKYDSDTYDTRNTWRSTDNNNNMVAVGGAMQQVLEENGIGVIHDTTQHDYPSYNGSYERSAKTIQAYLDEYPSIKIVLDLHRDAMERDNQAIVKPVAVVGGKKAAQIMIISGCDDGTMNMPDWAKNLRFAAALTDKINQSYPDLCRPIYLCYRKYNMDRSDGSLLLEIGSNANTLDEAVYSARLAGQALAELIKENVTTKE